MYVYVIGSMEPGPVKIGWSSHPAVRLKQLQTGYPHKLHLLYQHAGPRELEGVLHREFTGLRTHGEWFDFGAADPVSQIEEAASAYTRERSRHIEIRTDRAVLRGLWKLRLSLGARDILDQLAAMHDPDGVVEVTPDQLGEYLAAPPATIRHALADLDRAHLAWKLSHGRYQLNPTYGYRHGERNYEDLVKRMGPTLRYRKIPL
ncbi:hypothetical protein GCM10010371_57270 [Streptomyces subrutilus]|uniref:Bacteriophage T5 Orf172 DNA-binding domain-containing protein n=1 Tax=Streptomyces subrutilus TaxID=36818 RepID=A0A918R8W4_9ACTN|nr:GIY-YIG nuclease family protein [Streptomyces subrutilus]GGZ89923.1 hypothetical protein GCM10010371_57270 [Streptomyces subrutilus]